MGNIMKLRKPPIVQAWTEFTFEQNPEHFEWSKPIAHSFMDHYKAEEEDREELMRMNYTFEHSNHDSKPRIRTSAPELNAVRATNRQGSRYLQVVRDGFGCNFIRTQEGYEGFTSLKSFSLERFRTYNLVFKPVRLLQFALQYIDLVRIPYEELGLDLDLTPFFNIGVKFPASTFGPLNSLMAQFQTQVPDTNDQIEVRIRDERRPKSSFRWFRIEWRYAGIANIQTDENILSARLDEAHNRMLLFFRSSFTERVWQTFDPVEIEGE